MHHEHQSLPVKSARMGLPDCRASACARLSAVNQVGAAATGGFVGVALALAIATIVRSTTSLPISTPFFTIAIALTLSTVVGLFFGIYPAMRAARLDPIEALRSEV